MDVDLIVDAARRLWEGPGEEFVSTLGLAARSVIVLVAAFIAARFLDAWLGRRLRDRQVDPHVATLAKNLVGVAVYLVAFSIILGVFGASWSAVLTVIGASTIVISLSLQDLLKSYVAGVYMLLEQPIRVGDDIRINRAPPVEGVVAAIQLRTTRLVTPAGELVIVPNSTIFLEIVTNYSRIEPDQTNISIARLDLPLPAITGAVHDALAPLAGSMTRLPTVEIQTVDDTGATARITMRHQPGALLTTDAMSLLRERFPTTTLSRERD